jgi:hypothetical protein
MTDGSFDSQEYDGSGIAEGSGLMLVPIFELPIVSEAIN